MTRVAGALVIVFLLGSCAAGAPGRGSAGQPESTTSASALPGETSAAPGRSLEAADLIGTLGGDPNLEGGCAWIDGEDGERYEVVYPEGWHIETDPLRLLDPNGEVAAEGGDRIGLVGGVGEGMASICQVGTIFIATEVLTED